MQLHDARSASAAVRSACLVAMALLALRAGWAGAEEGEYYVSPDGKPDGDGTRQRPLDLATALSAKGPAKPGETIWLLGGTYRGRFESVLEGTDEEPITVRQAPGERAIIDGRSDDGKTDNLFTVRGQHVRFWGFEVTCTDPKRTTRTAGSAPGDIRRGGVNCFGSHISFINMIVHDSSNGFGFWSSGEGGEIYGCLIYNNGWLGPDRGHGHAIYAQNSTGVKRLTDNVMFHQFGYGVHAYGSDRATLKGFRLEGNVSFNNGAPAGAAQPNILVGGGCPAAGVVLEQNVAWHRDASAASVRLGYGDGNGDLAVEDNTFVGSTVINDWKLVRFTGNRLIGSACLLRLATAQKELPGGYEWNDNCYYGIGDSPAQKRFELKRGEREQSLDISVWRMVTGMDAGSKYAGDAPAGVQVHIRPNRYEPGRAHIVVCNWAKRDAVDVDLKDLLKIGADYTIAHAADYFGQPAAAGAFKGEPVRLPLKPVQAVKPIGMDEVKLPPTGPTFSVFVLRPGK